MINQRAKNFLFTALKSNSAQNALVLVVVNGVIGVFSIFTQVLIANALGRELFGTYCYYIAIGTIGATLVRYGRDRTLIRDLIQKPGEFNRIVGSSVILSFAITICFSLGLVFYAVIQGESLPVVLWLVVFGLIGVSFDLQPVYDSWGRMSRHSLYNFLQKMTGFIPVWIAVFCIPGLFSMTFVAWFILMGVMISLMFQYYEVYQKTHFRFLTRENIGGALRQFFDSSYIAVATMLGLFFGPMVQVFLKHYCDETQVGIFGAGWQITLIMMFVSFQVARVGNPVLARVNSPGVPAAKKRKVVYYYLFLMLICSLIFTMPGLLMPKWIISSLYKPEFMESSILLPVFSVYCIVFSLGCVFAQFVQTARRDRIYMMAIITGTVVSLIFCVLIIPLWGAFGAALALLIGHGSTILIYGLTTFSILQK
jgi:O-antigen/teichoic acid export membrane protein